MRGEPIVCTPEMRIVLHADEMDEIVLAVRVEEGRATRVREEGDWRTYTRQTDDAAEAAPGAKRPGGRRHGRRNGPSRQRKVPVSQCRFGVIVLAAIFFWRSKESRFT